MAGAIRLYDGPLEVVSLNLGDVPVGGVSAIKMLAVKADSGHQRDGSLSVSLAGSFADRYRLSTNGTDFGAWGGAVALGGPTTFAGTPIWVQKRAIAGDSYGLGSTPAFISIPQNGVYLVDPMSVPFGVSAENNFDSGALSSVIPVDGGVSSTLFSDSGVMLGDWILPQGVSATLFGDVGIPATEIPGVSLGGPFYDRVVFNDAGALSKVIPLDSGVSGARNIDDGIPATHVPSAGTPASGIYYFPLVSDGLFTRSAPVVSETAVFGDTGALGPQCFKNTQNHLSESTQMSGVWDTYGATDHYATLAGDGVSTGIGLTGKDGWIHMGFLPNGEVFAVGSTIHVYATSYGDGGEGTAGVRTGPTFYISVT